MKLHIARRIRATRALVLLICYYSRMAPRSLPAAWGCRSGGCSTMWSLFRHACPVCVRHESSCVSRPPFGLLWLAGAFMVPSGASAPRYQLFLAPSVELKTYSPLPGSIRRLGLDPRPRCPATPLSPAGAATSPPCSLMRRPSQMSAMRADRYVASFLSPSSLTWGMVGCPCRRWRRFAL
jgi:hypothetical protein